MLKTKGYEGEIQSSRDASPRVSTPTQRYSSNTKVTTIRFRRIAPGFIIEQCANSPFIRSQQALYNAQTERESRSRS